MAEIDWFTQFEGLGVPQVRALTPQWDGELQKCAYKWLKIKDEKAAREETDVRQKQEEARRLDNEAAQSEQLQVIRELKTVSLRAMAAAAVAVPVSVVSTVIAVLAWLHVQH